MSDNQDKPVDFQRPPVVEVMCGASFEKLNAFKASHIGAFWKTLPEQFSLTEELAPVVRPGESIEFSQLPPHPRTWFMTESGQQLVQLQQNLFLYNWKQPDGDDSVEYPEFSNIFPEFLHFLGLF